MAADLALQALYGSSLYSHAAAAAAAGWPSPLSGAAPPIPCGCAPDQPPRLVPLDSTLKMEYSIIFIRRALIVGYFK